MSLYNKYRPNTFGEVVSHDVNMTAIKDQLISNRFSHSYIMAGQRGTGKTTTSKLFSRYIVCESPIQGEPCNECESCKAAKSGTHPDVIEIDGASNNSVADVRNLLDEIKYPPIRASKKIYIIDEVHMLSVSAFNALLTTLEEPPAYVIFIFATTELHKIPATIRSRCQIFTFSQIEADDIANRLRFVAQSENINLEECGARLIAQNSEGSMRDALSILEQLSHNQLIDEKVVVNALGLIDESHTLSLVEFMFEHDVKSTMEMYQGIIKLGKTTNQLIESMIHHLTSSILKGERVNDCSQMLKSLIGFKREVSKEKNIQLLFNLFIVEQCSEITHVDGAEIANTVSLLSKKVIEIEKFVKTSSAAGKRSDAVKESITQAEYPKKQETQKANSEHQITEEVKPSKGNDVNLEAKNEYSCTSKDASKQDYAPKIQSILSKLERFQKA